MKTNTKFVVGVLTTVMTLELAVGILSAPAEELVFQQVAAGNDHVVAVRNDGPLWTWGASTTTNSSSPVQIETATDWLSVAAGSSHTVALKRGGTLWVWGRNTYGQLGDAQMTPGKIGLPLVLIQPQDQTSPAGFRVSFAATVTGSQSLAYQWQCHGTNFADWTPVATNVLGSDPILFTDPQSSQFPRRFYRLFKP